MNTKETAKNTIMLQVIKDLSSNPIKETCLSLINWLFDTSKDRLHHITIGDFKHYALFLQPVSDGDLLRCVQYLSGDAIKVLEPKFEFVDGGYVYQVSQQELNTALKSENFNHPKTGEPVVDFEKKIFLYWKLNARYLTC